MCVLCVCVCVCVCEREKESERHATFNLHVRAKVNPMAARQGTHGYDIISTEELCWSMYIKFMDNKCHIRGMYPC